MRVPVLLVTVLPFLGAGGSSADESGTRAAGERDARAVRDVRERCEFDVIDGAQLGPEEFLSEVVDRERPAVSTPICVTCVLLLACTASRVAAVQSPRKRSRCSTCARSHLPQPFGSPRRHHARNRSRTAIHASVPLHAVNRPLETHLVCHATCMQPWNALSTQWALLYERAVVVAAC